MANSAPLPGATGIMPVWKRLVLVAASLGAGLAIVATVAGLTINWYYSHARPTRDWPEKDIQAYGLKASLKTRWRDDAVQFQLKISPLSPDRIDAFETSLLAGHKPLHLSLFFYDESGFQVCSDSIEGSDIKRDVDKNGKIASLSADATWHFCSYSRYKDSRRWGLSWKDLPNVSITAPGSPASGPPTATNSASGSEKMQTPERIDTLTGVDSVHGELDTEAGRVFSVYQLGEQDTIISWSAKERLRFSCKRESECIVVNTDRRETVHARLTK